MLLFLSLFLDYFFPAIIVFSPLIYGGVTILPLLIIELACFLLLFTFLLYLLLKGTFLIGRALYWPILLFIALIIFQLWPLSNQLLSFLSPSTALLYKEYSFVSNTSQRISVCPGVTVNMLLQVLSYFAFFVVALNYLDSIEKIKRIIRITVVCGFVVSMYGIIRKLSIPADTWNIPHLKNLAFSTFTNRNHFAAYIEMIIPLAIALAFIERTKFLRLAFITAASVMSFALFLSFSRAGVVCFLISFIVMLVILNTKINIKKITTVLLALILIFVVLFLSVHTQEVLKRLGSLTNPLAAYGWRAVFIKDSLNIAKDFPILGVGFGTYGNIYQKYSTLKTSGGLFISNNFAHNEPLQLLVEAGLIGFLLILIFLFFVFRGSFKMWRERNNIFVVYLWPACCMSLIVASLHSFFDFTMHIPANAILFFLVLAIFYRVIRLPRHDEIADSYSRIEIKLTIFSRVIAIGLLSVSLLFIENLIVNRYRAKKIVDNLAKEVVSLNQDKQASVYKKNIKAIDRAIAINPLSSENYRRKADIFWQLSLMPDFDKGMYELILGISKQECLMTAANLYKKAIFLNPGSAEYHFQLGRILDVLGDKIAASGEFKKALKLNPANSRVDKYVNNYLIEQ